MAPVSGKQLESDPKDHEGRRAQVLSTAYRAQWETMAGLAAAGGLSVGHVSRLIRAVEAGVGEA